MSVFYLKEHDTLPVLQVSLTNPDGSPHDLTGSTAWKLEIRLSDGTRLVRDMAIQGLPTAGLLRYAWVGSDWDAPSSPDADGRYAVGGLAVGPTLPLSPGDVEHRMQYEVTGPGGARLTFPNCGLNAAEAYDTLRIWADIGAGVSA